MTVCAVIEPLNASARVRRCSGNLRKKASIQRSISENSGLPPSGAMGRIALVGKSCDCGVEGREWVNGFHGRIGSKCNPCPTIYQGAEGIEVLHSFRALQIDQECASNVCREIPTKRSWAYHISLILSRELNTVTRPRKELLTHEWVVHWQ